MSKSFVTEMQTGDVRQLRCIVACFFHCLCRPSFPALSERIVASAAGKVVGDVRVSGFPKVQDTFARVIGYVEQSDIHSAHVSSLALCHCTQGCPFLNIHGITFSSCFCTCFCTSWALASTAPGYTQACCWLSAR